MKNKGFAMTMALSLLAASTAMAAQPNEGVCDELIDATPGLYGLCIAFCEAQDCQPDYELDDSYENCTPSSPKLLARYTRAQFRPRNCLTRWRCADRRAVGQGQGQHILHSLGRHSYCLSHHYNSQRQMVLSRHRCHCSRSVHRRRGTFGDP